MDTRKWVVFGIPGVIAIIARVVFNTDTLITALIFGVCTFVTYSIAKKTGYWKMPTKNR